jgi:uncharacterized protein YbjT (DUF2867 family)
VSVAIVGASGVIGRAAVRAFAGADPDVRAIVRRANAADELRALGAKVAVADVEGASDAEDAEDDDVAAALFGADSVCHLVGGLDLPTDEAYERTNAGSVQTVLGVARRTRVRRALFVSAIGADPASPNPFLRAKGHAEEAVRASGLEFVIVRTASVYGVGATWLEMLVVGASRTPPVVVGDPSRTVAPVFAEDVAAVLLAADDRSQPVHGTWALEGVDRVPARELVAALGDDDARPTAMPADVVNVERLLGRTLAAAAVEVLAGSWPADAPDAAAEFGVTLTPLVEGIRRIATAARLER